MIPVGASDVRWLLGPRMIRFRLAAPGLGETLIREAPSPSTIPLGNQELDLDGAAWWSLSEEQLEAQQL